MPLTAVPCRELCDWAPTPASRTGRRLFACRGCGSQWVRGQGWTPRQADGSEPPGIAAELRRCEDGAGSGGS